MARLFGLLQVERRSLFRVVAFLIVAAILILLLLGLLAQNEVWSNEAAAGITETSSAPEQSEQAKPVQPLQQSQQVPFGFSVTGVDLPWTKEMTKTEETTKTQLVTFEILNNTAADMGIALAFTPRLVKAGSPSEGIETSKLVTFTSELSAELKNQTVLQLPAAGSRTIELIVTPLAQIEGGKYQGYLVASQITSSVVLRLPIQVDATTNVPAPASTVKTWHVRVFRLWPLPIPFGERARIWNCGPPEWIPMHRWLCNNYLPLDADSLQKGAKLNGTLGTLVGSQGGSAAVFAGKGKEDLTSGHVGRALVFKGLDRVGTYEGTIDVNPASDTEGEVALKVQVSDIFVYPMLVIFLGFVLGLWSRRLFNVTLPLNQLKRRLEKDIPDSLKDAEKQFKDNGGEAYPNIKVASGITARASELQTDVNKLFKQNGNTLDDKAPLYVQTIDGIKELHTVLKGLPNLPAQMADITGVLSVAQGLLVVLERPASLPRDFGPLPHFIQEAQSLLAQEVTTVSDYTKYKEAIGKMTSKLTSWIFLLQRVKENRAHLETINEVLKAKPDALQPDEIKALSGAISKNEAAYESLWHVQEDDDARADHVATQLLDAHDVLAGIANYLINPQPALGPYNRDAQVEVAYAVPPGAVGAEQGWVRTETLPMHVPDTSSADRPQTTIWANWHKWLAPMTAAFLLLLAAVTGLTNLYFGKPFGTLLDYLAALGLGISAGAGFELASRGLEQLRQHRTGSVPW